MVWGLVALTACCSSDEARAQSRVRFGVTFGSGGVRIGVGNGPIYGPGYYGPGYYGPGYGRGYGPGLGYGVPPVVIAPRPVYVPQPVYIQSQPQYVPGVTTYVPATPAPVADGGEILLFSPATNTGDVNYTLNGQLFTMPPGTKQRFVNDRKWTIQFESAPGQVTAYTLESARYKFKPSETGLGLFQTQDTPEVAQPGLPPAPIPNPPEAQAPEGEATVIPSRPPLKTTP
jgi:hypothetical protein